jgi:hypothetical protein
VDGSGWDQSIINDGYDKAIRFWKENANIHIEKLSPQTLSCDESVDGLPCKLLKRSSGQIPARWYLAKKLAQLGISTPHVTFFNKSLFSTTGVPGFGYGGAPGFTYEADSAIGFLGHTIIGQDSNPNGDYLSVTLAHEWGHNFGLHHTFLGNSLMNEQNPGTLNGKYLDLVQVNKARYITAAYYKEAQT